MKIPKIIIYVYIAYILVAIKIYFIINEIFHYDSTTPNVKLIFGLSIPLIHSIVMLFKKLSQEKSNNKTMVKALKEDFEFKQ